jgi:hypothetical protein
MYQNNFDSYLWEAEVVPQNPHKESQYLSKILIPGVEYVNSSEYYRKSRNTFPIPTKNSLKN